MAKFLAKFHCNRCAGDRLRTLMLETEEIYLSTRNAHLHYNEYCGINEEIIMATLTVTERGQVTFRKEVLRHLGVKPGEKIELELLPDGRVTIHTARPKGSIEDFIGCLAGKTKVKLTIEEIKDATERAWAGLL
jgi:AbrB family looped-hinge helix DNA binding protein